MFSTGSIQFRLLLFTKVCIAKLPDVGIVSRLNSIYHLIFVVLHLYIADLCIAIYVDNEFLMCGIDFRYYIYIYIYIYIVCVCVCVCVRACVRACVCHSQQNV